MMRKTKSYSKNLIKSFGFAGSDMLKKMTSNTRDELESIDIGFTDMNKFFRTQRNRLQGTNNILNRSEIFKMGKDVLRDAAEDIKSGKLYDKYRDSSVDGELNWDNLDSLFSDDDDFGVNDEPSKKSAKKATMAQKLASHENRQNSQMISNTILNTTNALISNQQNMTTMMYSQNVALSNTFNRNINALSNNMTKSFDKVHNAQKLMLDNAANYYAESLKLQKRQVELLEKMIEPDMNSNSRKYKGGLSSVSDFSGLNFKKYGKVIKNNAMNRFDMLGDLESAINLMRMLNENFKGDMSSGGSGRNIVNPLQIIPQYLLESLVPAKYKKMIEGFDNTSSSLSKAALRKLSKQRGKSGILGVIGDILGVDNDLDKSKGSRDYNKGRVFWDGKSKKALEEIIPGYLASIESLLKGTEAKLFDYENNKFVTRKEAMKDMDEHFGSYAKDAYKELSNSIDKLIDKLSLDDKQREAQRAKVQKVYNKAFNDDRLLDKNTLKEYKGSMDVATYKILESVINRTDETNKYLKEIRMSSDLETIKDKYNKDKYENRNSVVWEENGLFSTSTKSDPRNRLAGGIFNQKDNYQKSIFDYLRMIEENTRVMTSRVKGTKSQTYNNSPATAFSNNGRESRVLGSSDEGVAPSSSLIDSQTNLAVNELLRDGLEFLDDNKLTDKSLLDKIPAVRNFKASITGGPIDRAINAVTLTSTKILHKALVDSGDGKTRTLVDHMRDIFDNPNSRMGKFLDSVEENYKYNNDVLKILDTLKSKLLDKVNNSKIVKGIKDYGSGVWDETKRTLKSGWKTVKTSVTDTKNDLKSALKAERNLVYRVQNEPISHNAFGTGGKEITHDQISALSKGEVVLNKDEAKTYFRLKEKFKSLKSKVNMDDDAFDKYFDGIFFKTMQAKGHFKDMNIMGRAKDGALRISNDLGGIGKNVMSDLTDLSFEVSNALLGKQFDRSAGGKTSKVSKEIMSTIQSKSKKIGSGALLGGGASLLLGTLGGPLLGAAVGAGLSIIKESDTMKEMLFGTEDKAGLIGEKPANFIKKYFPDFKKYGLTAGLLGMLPITPFGPVGGLMLGAAASFVKNNENAKTALFGEESLLGPKAFDYINKNASKLLTGAALGALTGPFGLIGNMAVGSGLAMLATSDKYKEAIMGKKDADGKYQNGILPSIRDHVVTPFVEFAKEVPKKFGDYVKTEVFKPIKEALKPINQAFMNVANSIKKKFLDTINKMIVKSIFVPIYQRLEDNILKPVKGIVSKIFGGTIGFAKRVIGAPVNAIRWTGNKLKDRQIKNNTAFYTTAGERLNYSALRGLDYGDNNIKFDQSVNDMSIEELDEALAKVKMASAAKDPANIAKAAKLAGERLNSVSNRKLTARDLDAIGKAIDKEKSKDKLEKVVRHICYKRKMSVKETHATLEVALAHYDDIMRIKSEDTAYMNSLFEDLDDTFGTKGIGDKNLGNLARYIEEEKKFRLKNSKVNPETGEVVKEASKEDIALANLKRINEQETPKYRKTMLHTIQTGINMLSQVFTGQKLFNVNKSIASDRASVFNNRYMSGSSLENSSELRDMFNNKAIDIPEKNYNSIWSTANKVAVSPAIGLAKWVGSKSGITKYDGEDRDNYEETEDGIIKYKINDSGEKEVDEGDATTQRTLRKRNKRLNSQNEILSSLKPKEDKNNKEEKKESWIKKLLGKASIFGAAKGLLGGIFGKFSGILGKLGLAGGLGGLGGGLKLGGFLGGGGALGMLGFVMAAPYLAEHVVPWVKDNFDTKILPFLRDKAIPATGKLISELVPIFFKGIFSLFTDLLPNILGGVKDLVTGKTGGDMLNMATGGQQDGEYQYNENGEVVRVSSGNDAYHTSRNVPLQYGLNKIAGRNLGINAFNKAGAGLNKAAKSVSKLPFVGKFGAGMIHTVNAPYNIKNLGVKGAKKGLSGFENLISKNKTATEKYLNTLIAKDDLVKSAKSKIHGLFSKILNFPFFKAVLGEEMVETLTKGGLNEFVEGIVEKVVKEGAESAAETGIKKGGKALIKGGLKAILRINPLGIILTAADIIDGYKNAYKYIGVSFDHKDEIPTGMRVVAALSNALSGYMIIIPTEVLFNLYLNTIAKHFGEEDIDKIKSLRDQSKKELADYNKKHNSKLTQKEYDKKRKNDKFNNSPFGKLVNTVSKVIAGDDPSIRKAVKNQRVGGVLAATAGYGDISTPSHAGKGGDTYYSQNDPRWASNKLAGNTMADAGCGPTSIAMALSNATGKKITPDRIAKDNMENLPGHSTWGLFPSVARKYKLGYNRVGNDPNSLIDNLSKGDVILSGVRRSYNKENSPYTNAGHIVVARGIKNGMVEIADPRGSKYSKYYSLDSVINDMTTGFRYDVNDASMGAIENRLGYAGGAEETPDSTTTTGKASIGGMKLGDKVVQFARSLKSKVKYQYGGNSFGENKIVTDCSGFTQYVFKKAANIDIPRSSGGQGGIGQPIDVSQARAGDIAAYSGHVGIFTDSSGNVIHNSMPGVNVIEGTYKQAGNGKPVNVRRVLGANVGDGTASSGEESTASTGTETASVASTSSSGGDPLSSFMGKIGSAFMNAGAKLFGLPTETEAPAAESTDASDSGGVDTSTQPGGSPGIHMKINRPDDITAAQLDAYLRSKRNLRSNFNGQMFKDAQRASGISATDILVWAALESGWGKSRIAQDKFNYFGIGAVDTNPYNGAYRYKSPSHGISEGAKWIARNYVHGKYKQDNFFEIFRGPGGKNVHRYSTDPQEHIKLTKMREDVYKIARSAGKGPEEAYSQMMGRYPKTEKEIEDMLSLESGYAGGAPEEGSGIGGKFPDSLNGFPYYSQCDPRWNKPGFNTTWTGCGPTSAAIVATAATGRRITPLDTGAAAKKYGDWNGNNASSHSIFTHMGKEFGYTATQNSSNKQFFENASKRIVQFAVGTGASPYTRSGHYVVALGEKDGKIVTNNPISVATSGGFDKSRYSPTRKSWAVSVNGKPLIWTGQGVTVSGDSSGGTSPTGETEGGGEEATGKHQQTSGANPFEGFMSKIGSAFMNAGAKLFGLPTESEATASTGTSTEGGETVSVNGGIEGDPNLPLFKNAVCTGFSDPMLSFGRPQGSNAVAAHNMPMGTIVHIPKLKGKLGGGKFKANNGKTYDLGEKNSGNFIVADNGGPFFDFDILGFNGGKCNMDVQVLKWGDGPMCWTMTKAIEDAKRRGTWHKYQNAFNNGMTTYGGYKTALLTKFSKDDFNNPLLNKNGNAGKGPDFFTRSLNAIKSSSFGLRKVAGYGDFHTGNDYDTKGKRSKVYSPVSGKVLKSSYSAGRGNYVTVKDSFGNLHNFDHLSSSNVRKGDLVGPNSSLGRVGDTGNAHGIHLHYGVTNKNKEAFNPDEYMKKYGAFGGSVEANTKLANTAGEVTEKAFSVKDKALEAELNKATSSKSQPAFYEAVLKFMIKIIEILSDAKNISMDSMKHLATIIGIMNKHAGNLPKEAQQEISGAQNSINESFARLSNSHRMGMADAASKESKLITSDIKELYDIMNLLASK